MVDAGAVFVPFRKDVLERAVAFALETKATEDDFTIADF